MDDLIQYGLIIALAARLFYIEKKVNYEKNEMRKVKTLLIWSCDRLEKYGRGQQYEGIHRKTGNN